MTGHSESSFGPLPGCPPLLHVRKETFSFDEPHEFVVKQYSSVTNPHIQKRIGGKVVVSQGPADQVSKVEALVVYGASHTGILDLVTFHNSPSALIIDTSTHSDRDYSTSPESDLVKLCLSIDVYLSIASDVTLDALDIDVSHLGVELKDGLSLAVTGESTITTHSSGVHSEAGCALNSRKTIVNVDSGSISGSFALLDLLLLSTKSGSIKADVTPKEAAEYHTEPASLIARSASGSVHIENPIRGKLPDREYHTEVVAASGSVSGTYIHGTRTFLKTYSGSIKAEILPFDGAAKYTTLTTESLSARTEVTLLEPYHNSDESMLSLESKHTSQSGSLSIRYPPQWEGTIDGSVLSGSIHLGDNIKIIEDHKLGPIRTVKAKKGEGRSHMTFETKSGSAKVTVE